MNAAKNSTIPLLPNKIDCSSKGYKITETSPFEISAEPGNLLRPRGRTLRNGAGISKQPPFDWRRNTQREGHPKFQEIDRKTVKFFFGS